MWRGRHYRTTLRAPRMMSRSYHLTGQICMLRRLRTNVVSMVSQGVLVPRMIRYASAAMVQREYLVARPDVRMC